MNRQPVSVPKYAALYERLSRDDEHQGPSHSIINQQKLLEELMEKYGYKEFRHFTDDGISGTRFDRPGFLQMMDEIETGNISAVLTKDASRIGRDHLRVGLFLETLRQKEIRFIAPGDNVDTAMGEDDFMPFRNIIHEWHVRDISRKIRAMFQTKGRSGKHTTTRPVYGYMRSPEDKNDWIIDEEAASVVRRIFSMTIDGKGAYQIARDLTDEKILRPTAHVSKREGGRIPPQGTSELHVWTGSTVDGILGRADYMGHTVNFQTYTASYKDKTRKRRAKEEQLIFENTHEAIIDPETWETAQKCRKVKRVRGKNGEAKPFTGLVYCPDCNRRMYNHRKGETHKYPTPDYYQCPGYNKYPKVCTNHYIRTDALNTLALDAIKAVSGFIKEDEDEFVRLVHEAHNHQNAETAKIQQKQLVTFQKRHTELDLLIKQLYEDKVKGSISEKRFEILSGEYETEQTELEQQIPALQTALEVFTMESSKTGSFIKLVKKYTDITELTPTILNEYIDRIYVHEVDKSSGDREQSVEISFNFIGRIDLPVEEPTPEELERLEKDRLRRKKNREYFRKWAAEKRPQKAQKTSA